MIELSNEYPHQGMNIDEYRQFIIPRVVNIFKTYEDGVETETRLYYPLTLC